MLQDDNMFEKKAATSSKLAKSGVNNCYVGSFVSCASCFLLFGFIALLF